MNEFVLEQLCYRVLLIRIGQFGILAHFHYPIGWLFNVKGSHSLNFQCCVGMVAKLIRQRERKRGLAVKDSSERKPLLSDSTCFARNLTGRAEKAN